MNKTLKLTIAALATGGLVATQALAANAIKMPTLNPKIKSIPGLNLDCNDKNQVCRVAVKVEPDGSGGCKASVDYEVVTVKQKETRIVFELARVDMGDDAKYEFYGQGIAFVDTGFDPTDTLEFGELAPLSGPRKDTLANWKSGKKKKVDIHYVPTVRRVSPTPADCSAHDPKINNDGG